MMKKLLIFCIIILLCNCTIVNAMEKFYEDTEIGVQFAILDGWSKESLTQEREHIKVKYGNNDGASIIFGWSDLWNVLTSQDKQGYTKKQFNNSAFSEEDVKDIFGNDGWSIIVVEKTEIKNIEYFKIISEISKEVNGSPVNLKMFRYVMFHDGIMYEFSYGDTISHSEKSYNDFMTVLNSIQYEKIDINTTVNAVKPHFGIPTNYSENWLWLSVVLSLILTVCIYSVPIIIYRYIIVKKAVEKLKAKRITIIYGIIAFFTMAFLTIDRKSVV